MAPDFCRFFESSPGLYLVLTPDLTIVAASDAYLLATTTRRTEILGRSLFDVFPETPGDSNAPNLPRASLEIVLRDRVPNVMPVQKKTGLNRTLPRDGTAENRYWSPVNYPVLDDAGLVAYIIHRLEDITEFVRFKEQDAEHGRRHEELRKRAEAVEVESSGRAKEIQQLNRFFTLSPDLLCIANMAGSFLRVNPAFTDTLGYTEEELLKLPFIHFVHPEDRAATLLELQKLSVAQSTVNFENRFQCKDGSWKWLAWKTQPSLEEGLLYVTARDVTESKHVTRQLALIGAAAESANRAKSEFLANMSHEIRTPLAAIVGYTDLMTDPDQTTAERANCISVIRSNGEHLLIIINDILDISKIEAGEMPLENIACSPSRLLNEVASTMRVRADEKSLKFEVNALNAMPETIHTDPTRLRQILINLVGNAIKFTETGAVRVLMKLEEAAAGGNPKLRFDVTDTGIGIKVGDMAHLFQPFSQADTSTTRRFGGSGLGLCISRKLAQLLGGDITVATEPDRGSTFTLLIDPGSLAGVKMLSSHDETASPEEPPAHAITHVKGHILLVEDNPDNQRLMAFYLRRDGAEVVVAGNGRIACDKALQAMAEGIPFDLIIMDMQMPVLDGYAASAELRAKGYKGPIVALTAHAMVTDRQKCIASGCNDYLSKPATRAALMEMTRRYLHGHPALPSLDAPRLCIADSVPQADMDLVSELTPQFVANLPESVRQLQKFLHEQDRQALMLLLHDIKGSSGMYHFPKIAALAVAVQESITRVSPMKVVEAQVASLIEVIQSIEGYAPRVEVVTEYTTIPPQKSA